MISTGDPSIDDTIEVVLPARTEFAATLRVLAASLGADLGFSVDEIDDLRLALNEVFTSAADTGRPERISVSFRPDTGRLDVMAYIVGAEVFDLDDLALTILRSVVDEVSITGQTISFAKQARESVG